MDKDKQTQLINEFVGRLRAAAADNLRSVILYGSAADGEFHPEYSDLNLLCVVQDASFASLGKLGEVVDWWRKQKHHPPLIIRLEELRASAEVFPIEFVDIKQRYRVLFGEDALQTLDVPMGLHLFQLRYELREKLMLLRQHILSAADKEKQLWEVMLHSLSSLTTLFRHVLVELGDHGRKHSREAVTELAAKMNFEAAPFVQLMDVRAGTINRNRLSAAQIAGQYLDSIEKVAAAVDTMQ